MAELIAVGDELWDLLGVEELLPVLLDPLLEVGPVGKVDVVGAAGMVAGVVAQLEELVDVGVPALGKTQTAPAAAALVDGGD